MEITLEKIELVKDRTGVSYKEAKEALEEADGSVVDAIIAIEETIDSSSGKKLGEQGVAIVEALKDLIKKGNVAKIVVKKKDGEVMICLPVNVGIVGVLFAPLATVAGVIAALGFKCIVEIVKTDGTIIDVSDTFEEFAAKATEKGTEFAQVAKEKGSEFAHAAKEKGSEFAESAKEKGAETYDKVKESEAYDKVVDAYEKTSDAVKSQINKNKTDLSEGFEDLEDNLEEMMGDLKDRAEDTVDDIKKE